MNPTTQRTTRAAGVVAAVALVVVAAAPVVLSFHSLAAWGRDSLALEGWLPYMVPVALDAAALTCVALTLHAVMRADSAGAARLLVWVMATASAVANVRHGTTISADAAVFLGAMPILAALLLDIALRRVLRAALASRGAIEQPLPRYRAARWLIAPRETWRAWCTAVREGIVNPADALRVSRRRHDPAPEVPGVDETPAELAADAAELAGMNKTDAMRMALAATDGEVPRAMTWLARRGVEISANHAHKVARKVRAERPALAAVAGGAS